MKLFFKYLMAAFYFLAGLNHFLNTTFYLPLIPSYLPFPLALIYISGFAEMFLGALVLIPRFQRIAGWGIIALLIAVFPANIHLALHPEIFPGIPPYLFWLRLPLQLPLIAWAYYYVLEAKKSQILKSTVPTLR